MGLEAQTRATCIVGNIDGTLMCRTALFDQIMEQQESGKYLGIAEQLHGVDTARAAHRRLEQILVVVQEICVAGMLLAQLGMLQGILDQQLQPNCTAQHTDTSKEPKMQISTRFTASLADDCTSLRFKRALTCQCGSAHCNVTLIRNRLCIWSCLDQCNGLKQRLDNCTADHWELCGLVGWRKANRRKNALHCTHNVSWVIRRKHLDGVLHWLGNVHLIRILWINKGNLDLLWLLLWLLLLLRLLLRLRLLRRRLLHLWRHLLWLRVWIGIRILLLHGSTRISKLLLWLLLWLWLLWLWFLLPRWRNMLLFRLGLLLLRLSLLTAGLRDV
eukprot:comp22363_c0_seq1/m.54089 comp22363_c0_seq1/g.54089  ORF comp22363_c0_seq1/g.54089 comp22363_c0_seq1/m.54089 type:complete len:330 (-) comp22363_c0_seq1:157-1146(-)